MIKGVIFDFDGVIVDSEYISYECYRDFLENYNISFSKDDYIEHCPGKTLVTTMNFFKKHYNLEYDIDSACAFFREREQYYVDKDGVALKAGIKDLMNYLKNKDIYICLATSSVKKRALTILNEHKLTGYFDDFVFGDEVERSKPFPDVFLTACKKISINPEEALVIEDSEAGIEAAHNAKISVICIPDMKQPDHEHCLLATKIYPDLSCVKDYIEQVNGNG